MDPITAAISAFSPTNIFLAGAALITLVITIVGIDKVKELFYGEMPEAYLEDGKLYQDFDPADDDNYGFRRELTSDGWEQVLTPEAEAEAEEHERDAADRWGVSYERYMSGPQDDEDWEDFIERAKAEDAAENNGG